MSSPHDLESLKEQEQEILHLLCNLSDSPPDRARSHALCALAWHDWKDADHRVVFIALRRSPGRDPQLLREQLPAEATRLGFPDVDWTLFFDDVDPPEPQRIEILTHDLLQASGEGPGRP